MSNNNSTVRIIIANTGDSPNKKSAILELVNKVSF